MKHKERLDVVLVERGLCDSRSKAQALIMSGEVYVNGQKSDKAGTPVEDEAVVELRGNPCPYVSRGGLKLEKALRDFGVDPTGFVCSDSGASTGGFTDCLLQKGAKKVFAIDVGYGQLAWSIRQDPRVVCMERTNIRYVTPEQLGEPLDLSVVDVSFISLRIVLPAIRALLKPTGQILCLIKPQFEAGREKVGKKGVVRDPAVHEEVLQNFLALAAELELTVRNLTFSPVRGPEGNIEFLGHLSMEPQGGITPDVPETGFGYIRRGEALPAGGYAVERFVEKPDLARAEVMLADGGYLWNSGMFLFRASVYLEELALHAPGIHAACKAAWEGHHADQDFIRPDADAFLGSPADSIDYAVMEKTARAAVVPLTADWSDLGSWEAFYEAAPHDVDGNVRVGDVYAEGAENCYLHASNRMVAALGVSDLVVVETADSVLVADRARTQDVKKIVESLKTQGRGEAENHPLVYRPWGSYETLARGERFQVKRIIVKPGGQLSLQKHHHRAEHWVVVEGTAEITVGDKVLLYHEDQSTYIPLGTVHRLKNPGMIPLVIIEIQSGTYLGEDDIVRLEDSYGR